MNYDAPKTYTIKVAILLIMIFLTKIPVAMISGLTDERGTRQTEAQKELSRMTGGDQQLVGPFLALKTIDTSAPNTVGPVEQTAAHPIKSREEKLRIVPSELKVTSQVNVERRYRGIYPLETFVATTSIKGVFNLAGHEAEQALVHQQIADAAITVGVTNPDYILSIDEAKWGDESLHVDTGTAANGDYEIGIPISVNVPATTVRTGNKIPFSLTVKLRGSGSFSISPVAERWELAMSSNSAFPSFIGKALPIERELTPEGFTAVWRMEKYGKTTPAVIKTPNPGDYQKYFADSAGVSFKSGINTYEMVQRAIKYSLLFIVLTFAIFFLFEVICGLKLHAVQYGLIASALCIFYLLLLSIAEYCSFSIAYGVATLTVVVLVSGYSRAILSNARQANLVASLLTIIYGYLYIVLGDREYALLLGSIGVTAVLGFVMYLTRNVDWYEIGGRAEQESTTN